MADGGGDINVLAMEKGDEKYIWLYGDDRLIDLMRSLGKFASDPDLSFTWYDAAVLSNRARQTAAAAKQKETEEKQEAVEPQERDWNRLRKPR
jgi:hypothetical protein